MESDAKWLDRMEREGYLTMDQRAHLFALARRGVVAGELLEALKMATDDMIRLGFTPDWLPIARAALQQEEKIDCGLEEAVTRIRAACDEAEARAALQQEPSHDCA